MILRLYVLSLALLLAAPALAGPARPTPTPTPTPAPVAPNAVTATATPTPTPAPPPPAKSPGILPNSQERGLLNVNVTLFSVGLPVPNKFAITFGLNIKRLLAFEVEYFGGSYDKKVGDFEVSSLTESILVGRLRLWPTRRYFNLFAGYGERWLDADVLATDATLRSRVVEAGVGHRVDFGRLTLGADWLTVYVPVGQADVSTTDPLQTLSDDDRKNVDSTLSKLKNFPTIALFKLYLGFNF